jgi:hypothetical protein
MQHTQDHKKWKDFFEAFPETDGRRQALHWLAKASKANANLVRLLAREQEPEPEDFDQQLCYQDLD